MSKGIKIKKREHKLLEIARSIQAVNPMLIKELSILVQESKSDVESIRKIADEETRIKNLLYSFITKKKLCVEFDRFAKELD